MPIGISRPAVRSWRSARGTRNEIQAANQAHGNSSHSVGWDEHGVWTSDHRDGCAVIGQTGATYRRYRLSASEVSNAAYSKTGCPVNRSSVERRSRTHSQA